MSLTSAHLENQQSVFFAPFAPALHPFRLSKRLFVPEFVNVSKSFVKIEYIIETFFKLS
jgi:hypothetical protein